MTQVPAPIKKPTIPDLTILLDTLKHELFLQLNCVKVGIIQSFDPVLQEAVIKIAYTQVTSIDATGKKTLAEYPLLLNVPVQFPSGGGFTLTFPISAGDECILLFNDQQIDSWVTAGIGHAPLTDRAHDLSDAIAIVGLRDNTRPLQNFSTSSTQLRTDDGNTFVDVSNKKIQIVADEVVIHGNIKTTFDAGGTGFVYTAGQIDTYTDGVPSTNHAPTPPEVPT